MIDVIYTKPKALISKLEDQLRTIVENSSDYKLVETYSDKDSNGLFISFNFEKDITKNKKPIGKYYSQAFIVSFNYQKNRNKKMNSTPERIYFEAELRGDPNIKLLDVDDPNFDLNTEYLTSMSYSKISEDDIYSFLKKADEAFAKLLESGLT